MLFKKSQVSTDTPILISIVAFYAIIVLGLGFINVEPPTTQNSINTTSYNSSYESSSYSVPLTNFSIANIVSSISYLGWFNAPLFTPLIVAIVYIIAKLIRGGG